jgi:hypothetical protein
MQVIIGVLVADLRNYENLVLESVSLFFLDDILVGIHIKYPERLGISGDKFNLLKFFKEKYGDGVGNEESSSYWTWDNEKKRYDIRDLSSKEKREWDNGVINVVYYSKYVSESASKYSFSLYYMIYSLKEKYQILSPLR